MYNFPATVNGGAEFQQPIAILKDIARPEDLVVFKLDIDTPEVELPLAQAFLDDQAARSLIDEFYFEHHVTIQDMRYHWKSKVRGSLADSIHLFQNFRKLGIRAHSWP